MNTKTDISAAYVGSTQVSKLYLGNEVVWPTTPPAPVPYEQQYFTVEANEAGNFYVRSSNFLFSKNGGAWTSGTGNTTIPLAQGDKVRFKHDVNSSYPGMFSGNTMSFQVYGNIESMEYGDSFSGTTTVKVASGFSQYFLNCSGLADAENLILPATTLKTACYYRMFRGCTNLVTAPFLPAPQLPANSYKEMFSGCTSLMYIACLATSKASDSTTYWVLDVNTTGGTFVKDPSVRVGVGNFWTIGIGGVPSGWTVQNYVDPSTPVLKIAGQSITGTRESDHYEWGGLDQYSGTSFTIEVLGVPITADTWDYSETYQDECGAEIIEISHDSGATMSIFEVYSGYIDAASYDPSNNSVQYSSLDDQTSEDSETICRCQGLCWDGEACVECPSEDPCDDWEGAGYSSYEECNCAEHGVDCEGEGDPCDDYEGAGYGSYEECTCAERGENCPEESGEEEGE